MRPDVNARTGPRVLYMQSVVAIKNLRKSWTCARYAAACARARARSRASARNTRARSEEGPSFTKESSVASYRGHSGALSLSLSLFFLSFPPPPPPFFPRTENSHSFSMRCLFFPFRSPPLPLFPFFFLPLRYTRHRLSLFALASARAIGPSLFPLWR